MTEKKMTAIEQRITTHSIRHKDQKAFPNPLTFAGFNPDPWILNGSAGQICKLDTIRFTIYEDTNVQYTLNWNYTSLGWTANPGWGPPPDITIQIKDGQGGLLDTWDIGHPNHPCGVEPEGYTTQNGKANILANTELGVTIIIGPATWGHC